MMEISSLLSFMESFHSFVDFGKKLEIFGGFLRDAGASKVYFLPVQNLHDYKLITGSAVLGKSELDEICAKLTNADNKEVFVRQFGGVEFEAAPVSDTLKTYGWLLSNPAGFLEENIRKIVTLELICCLKQFENYEASLRQANQLATIRMLSEKVSGFYNLKELLNIVTQYVTKAIGSQGTVIRLVNERKDLLDVISEYGLENINIRRYGVKRGSGYSGAVWETKAPRLVKPETEESKELLGSKLKVRSLICVPLIFENEVIGILSVYEKISGITFEEEDKAFVEVIASLVSPIIAYADALVREKVLLGKLQRNLKDMNLISEINKVLMQPQKVDELLYILLTALTFGEEIGFNRAALFIYNGNTGTVQGMLGIGCETFEETRAAWENLPKDITAVKWLEKLSLAGSFENTPFSAFNDKIKRLRFNINDVPAISYAIKSGRINLSVESEEDLLKGEFGVHEYAIIPLIGEEEVLGMLYVDNKFTGKKIDESYVILLETFASQAVLAIENSKLYSELREANDLLKTARQELLMKEKLAIVGEMLTTLAHEIRNPLTAIGGFSNIMIKRIHDPALKELAQKISSQAAKMDNMFKEFLFLTKHSSFRCDYEDVNSIVTGCMETFSLDEKSGISFSVEQGENLPPVYMDKNMFEIVVNNLIKNALQAMPGGGKISIRTYREKDFVVFAVEDEGHGIPSNVLPNIFDPFYTTKFNGVGIGLSISYKVIKQLGGIIYAENIKEGGARFVVKLPLQNKVNTRGLYEKT